MGTVYVCASMLCGLLELSEGPVPALFRTGYREAGNEMTETAGHSDIIVQSTEFVLLLLNLGSASSS